MLSHWGATIFRAWIESQCHFLVFPLHNGRRSAGPENLTGRSAGRRQASLEAVY
jgi:hypothetical protein